MDRKNNKKSASGLFSSIFGDISPQNRRRLSNMDPTLNFAIVFAAAAVLWIGFKDLEKYVRYAVPVSQRIGLLELVNPPWWINEQLKWKIYEAATANGEDLRLDEDSAQTVQQNLEKTLAWLQQVKVQTTSRNIRVNGNWRRPIAFVEVANEKFYLDTDMVVLDFVEIQHLPIIKIEGVSAIERIPVVGSKMDQTDLKEAVAILARLDRRDNLNINNKRLLYEISRLDISNFNGRKNNTKPHIVLYASDETEIIWGAELDRWHRHLEVKDEQKIARLYSYYSEKGTLLGGAKYINLRDPQEKILLPIDRY